MDEVVNVACRRIGSDHQEVHQRRIVRSAGAGSSTLLWIHADEILRDTRGTRSVSIGLEALKRFVIGMNRNENHVLFSCSPTLR